jgi:microcystin-dependent protein
MAEPFIGQIIMFGGNFAIRGYALCNGQLLSIAQNTALFSLLGTTFGGDGRTTFGLPDLRGRVPVHMGQGPGLTNYSLGQSAGAEQVTLTVNQIPAHTHTATANAVNGPGNSNVAAGNAWAKDLGTQSATYSNAAPTTPMRTGAVTVAAAGGNQPHSNLQPYLCINFLIALEGIYPSRD